MGMKRLTILLFLFMAACTPKRDVIPTYWGLTPTQARLASELHAKDVGGLFYHVAPTGSMEPFLTGGDYIVVQKVPYKDVKPGMMANYQARWLPPSSPTVTHWVADRLGDEFIMDGQANSIYENKGNMLMGEKEFIGQVIAIYTTREKP